MSTLIGKLSDTAVTKYSVKPYRPETAACGISPNSHDDRARFERTAGLQTENNLQLQEVSKANVIINCRYKMSLIQVQWLERSVKPRQVIS
jgi:hypothetical protein